VESRFRYCLGTLGPADIMNFMIRWSNTETSLVTLQSTMSCQMVVDDNDMSKTSDLVRVTTVSSFPRFRFSRVKLTMDSERAITLLLVSVPLAFRSAMGSVNQKEDNLSNKLMFSQFHPFCILFEQ
jgi:hypothetical protein